ncbi:hypothetical protein PR048_025751 [Dryococelus australis]|uniref:Uncharacterized protein n=1 Tax=Dryococelus australis TaxID=614101 RepID=A0ABQ9GJH2_9NEOP|nr:hypothetical protein PR048_025751 [Dryococelus australis]
MKVMEVSMEQSRNKGVGGTGDPREDPPNQRHRPARFPRAKIRLGTGPECKDGANGRSPRKLTGQRHRPARFPLAKIREGPGPPRREASRLTAEPPRHPPAPTDQCVHINSENFVRSMLGRCAEDEQEVYAMLRTRMQIQVTGRVVACECREGGREEVKKGSGKEQVTDTDRQTPRPSHETTTTIHTRTLALHCGFAWWCHFQSTDGSTSLEVTHTKAIVGLELDRCLSCFRNPIAFKVIRIRRGMTWIAEYLLSNVTNDKLVAKKHLGGGNGRSPRKHADQRHRPTRFPNTNIWSDPPGELTRIALVGGEQANRSSTAAPTERK